MFLKILYTFHRSPPERGMIWLLPMCAEIHKKSRLILKLTHEGWVQFEAGLMRVEGEGERFPL